MDINIGDAYHVRRTEYLIAPVPKPRMTRADRWKKRPCVTRYFEFKDKIRESGLTLPTDSFNMEFVMPMPKSWSKKKKAEMDNTSHMQRPDLDNLIKALLDAVFDEDCKIWSYSASKLWGYEGKIIISQQ